MTTEEILLATIASLQKTNRSLNRRANALESPWRKEVERLKIENEMCRSSWVHQFDRTGGAFDYLKRIYAACAAELGLPHGRYSSVNDCSHAVRGEPYTVRAAVIRDDGTVEVYRILDVVAAVLALVEKPPAVP